MNNDLIKILKEHNIHPISYVKMGKCYLVNGKYVIKLDTSNYDIYKYLVSRDFIYFPETYNHKTDNYDIVEYIEDIDTKTDQKINDLIFVLSNLHFKTSYIREMNLDEIKNIYEQLNDKINNAKNYYLNLNDLIDKELFYSPSMYLLIKNISLFYYLLEYASKTLNEWYIKIKDEKSIRISLLHNNVSVNHLIINDSKYLISWDKAYFDSPIYDIESFYRKYFSHIKLDDLFKLYEKNNKLSEQEKKLLLVRLMIPNIISLTKNTYLDTQKINDEINYLNRVYEIIKLDTKVIKNS